MDNKIDYDYLEKFNIEDDEFLDFDEEVEYSNFDKNVLTIDVNELNTEEFIINREHFDLIYNFEKCIKERNNSIDLNSILCGTTFIFDKEITYYLFEEERESDENYFIFLFEDNNDYIYYDDLKSKILISRDRYLCEKYVKISNDNFKEENYLNKLKNIIIVYNFEIDKKRTSINEALSIMNKNISFMQEN